MAGLARRSPRASAFELFDELDAPVMRVACPFAPIPFAPELERALLPGTPDIVRAVRALPKSA